MGKRIPAIRPRRYLDSDEVVKNPPRNEYIESDRDFVLNNITAAVMLLERELHKKREYRRHMKMFAEAEASGATHVSVRLKGDRRG